MSNPDWRESPLHRVLDPAWAERYVEIIGRLNAALKEHGSDGLSALLEIEGQRIRMESDATMAAHRLAHELELERMRFKTEQAMMRVRGVRRDMPWTERIWPALLVLGLLSATAIALWQAWRIS